ncbi:MAG: MFS transporter [Parachlamydiaceae bacterium]|nr:MFS transporter [Parachlamydiaceae bacterium]
MAFQSLLKVFAPAPHLAEIADQETVNKDYKYWRHRIFYSMLLGYAMYYFTRRSFTFAMPGLIADLGFDKSQLGILGSVLSISYGMSKFISGLLADQSNPRYFMALGLFLTGICNICFGFSSSLWMFIIFWGANGLFQGFGWPACTRSLTHWYSHSERGAWWSSTSVAHNLGAFVTPWVVGLCLQYFGWRAGMYVPGVVCIAGSFFLINRMRDTPQSLGLPPIEKYRHDYPGKAKESEEKELSTRELLKGVLSNKYIWLLAFAYFFLYVLRMGIGDWTALFLYEVKGYGALGSSGTSSLFEAGGFCGCLAAGWSSDRLFGAKRGPVCVLFAVGILCSIFLFWIVPAGYIVLDWITIYLMGFAVFGPQMLVGICASELCHKKAAATANGFVGWVAYIGAAVAGYPMGLVIDFAGWSGAFVVLLTCSILFLLLLLPLWGVTRATVEASEQKAYA